MATAASLDQQDLIVRFEKWFTARLRPTNDEESSDELIMISNYISSSLAEEDAADEDKRESIRPFIQELNQNERFNEDEILDEIITSWSQMKLCTESEPVGKKPDSSEPNPTDTILSMINKHKTQVVASRKPIVSHDDEQSATDAPPVILTAPVVYKSDDDEDEEKVKEHGLFKNTNTQEALTRDKQQREKLSEAHAKQKEQAKKALQEQREREVERKKKAQQKAAKVERKR